MPVSKQRKKKGIQHRTPKSPKPDLTFDGKNFWIGEKKYDEIKSNPDFIAAVRLGRVVNALSFSVNLLIRHLDFKSESPATLRNHVRSLMLVAGYVHEALSVFYSLRLAYQSFDFFSKIDALLYPTDKSREILLKVIRDGGAFHLDSDNKITAKTLLALDSDGYDIFTAESDSAFHFYFNFSDVVDLNHFLAQMSDEMTLQEKQNEMFLAVNQVAKDAFIAAHECLLGLLLRLPFGLKERKL
ncbi:MAG: hypothetical protein ABI539_09770 [Acidobacteriota bacterium]